ncbi:hypothetical protein QUF74_13160 [Candidatus Halobeggiatoa sp. HSG11]|nr:hypothetical protein [Candidatus Halobeggiatoa sp. HSG11]
MQFVTNDVNEEHKQLCVTMTGEFVQPVRVYYNMLDKQAIKRVFHRLRCMKFDSKRDRQVWLYQKESKKLNFEKPYSSIPKKYHPIVIGAFLTKENNEMYLETRSVERAIKGIVFFDKYIKKNMAEITDVCIINKLFSATKNVTDFDSLFDKAVIIDPEKKLAEIETMIAQGKDISSILKERQKNPLPEVERFPAYFYEDGIESLGLAFQGRQYVAMQHWEGNKDCTLDDYVSMANNSTPITE